MSGVAIYMFFTFGFVPNDNIVVPSATCHALAFPNEAQLGDSILKLFLLVKISSLRRYLRTTDPTKGHVQ